MGTTFGDAFGGMMFVTAEELALLRMLVRVLAFALALALGAIVLLLVARFAQAAHPRRVSVGTPNTRVGGVSYYAADAMQQPAGDVPHVPPWPAAWPARRMNGAERPR